MSELTAACFGSDTWPTVSVVMPIRNEAPYLERAVASILAQDYPLPFDVCLAIAPSDDGTETIAASIARTEPRVSLVSNPAGITPAGLNAAISATSGTVIVRVDGHAELSEGYIRRAIETMRRTGAVNVGGIQAAVGETPFEQAVATAMASWMGTGGARFHVGGAEAAVDTVYLGVFDRAAGDAVGWFDETLIRNQDYELNIRLRQAGGTVWFNPELSVSYRPRGSITALAKQYYQYGYWKARVGWIHPASLRPRQIIPPIALVIGTMLSAIALRSSMSRRILASVIALFAIGTVTSAPNDRARAFAVFPTMHLSWSFGFVRGIFGSRRSPVPARPHCER